MVAVAAASVVVITAYSMYTNLDRLDVTTKLIVLSLVNRLTL
jgi:hypothetical protein